MPRIGAGRWAWLLGVSLLVFVLALPACGEEEDATENGTPEATAVAEENGAVADDVPGVTDTQILIGSHLPLSGLAAAWGVDLKAGMEAYVDYVNEQGGVHGRRIKLIVYDSEYTGPAAAEAVRKLVEQDEVFATMGGLGSAAHGAVWKYLEEGGVPDMFILSGDAKWTEPVVRSRFGIIADYVTEGRVLGQYIADNIPGKKLGIIAQNDDLGKGGEEGLRLGVADADMEVVVEYYEPTEADLTAQVQRLRKKDVDVIAAYTMPPQAGSMIKAARETLNWDVPIVLTGVDAIEVVALLGGLDNVEGIVSVMFAHQAFETDVPGVARLREILAEYAPEAQPSNLAVFGAGVAEAMVHILEETGPELTRESFLDTAESICDWMCSVCIVPMRLSPTDHRPFEVGILVRATVDRSTDPPTFRWKPFGEPLGFESTEECPE